MQLIDQNRVKFITSGGETLSICATITDLLTLLESPRGLRVRLTRIKLVPHRSNGAFKFQYYLHLRLPIHGPTTPTKAVSEHEIALINAYYDWTGPRHLSQGLVLPTDQKQLAKAIYLPK